MFRRIPPRPLRPTVGNTVGLTILSSGSYPMTFRLSGISRIVLIKRIIQEGSRSPSPLREPVRILLAVYSSGLRVRGTHKRPFMGVARARSWSRLPAFVNFWQEVPTFAEKSCKIDF